jgi:hypothetical protein
MVFLLSIRTGFVNPNALMLAAICRRWCLLCVRALQGLDTRASIAKYEIVRSDAFEVIMGAVNHSSGVGTRFHLLS